MKLINKIIFLLMLFFMTSNALYSKSFKTKEVFLNKIDYRSKDNSFLVFKNVPVLDFYFFKDSFSFFDSHEFLFLRKSLERRSNSKFSTKRRKLGKANINPFFGIGILSEEEKIQNFLFNPPLLFYYKKIVTVLFYYVQITPD